MRLSVIIVNYNVKYFLEQCLFSAMKATKGIDSEIIVFDNASVDGSRDYLEPRFPDVQFHWNEINAGFAKANNDALKKAKGEYILFLNPDTIVPEDCFQLCLEYMDKNTDAGALGIRMVDGSGKFLPESKRAFPSPATAFYKLTGLATLFPGSSIFARYHMGHLDPALNHYTDVLAGAFMLVRKKILDLTGGFDEAFFMYGEDIDLSYRIIQSGYRNVYFAESQIIHFKGESTKKGSLNYIRMFYSAMGIFVQKHYGGAKAGLFLFFIQLAIIIRAFFSALGSLLRPGGLPIIDALIIFGSFWLASFVLNGLATSVTGYPPLFSVIPPLIFILIFNIAAYYAGLYQARYKKRRLTRSVGVTIISLLVAATYLPESFKLSHSLVLCAGFFSFLLLKLCRILIIKRSASGFPEKIEKGKTLVAGTTSSYQRVYALMNAAGLGPRIKGRVAVNTDSSDCVTSLNQLQGYLTQTQVKEIILCENGFSFKEIIAAATQLPEGIRIRISADGSTSVVGSDSKYDAGETFSVENKYALSFPENRRLKRGVDFLYALLMFLSFPVHLFRLKNTKKFFNNCWSVLTGKKTWVGYQTGAHLLPPLKQAVIGTNGQPQLHPKDAGDAEAEKEDYLYACNYTVSVDLNLLWKNYRHLSA